MDGNKDEIEIVDEIATEEIAEQKSTTTAPAKKSKLAEAQELIESSKELVSKADSEVEECKIGISEAAEAFDVAKQTLNSTTFNECNTLLQESGFEYTSYDEDEPFELSLNEDENEIFSVQNISTGRFTGLILAILAALGTVVAWIYIASKKLNIDLNGQTAETAKEQVNPILNWIGGDMIGANSNMMVGALVLGLSALIIAWLVYALRVSLKGKKNLRIAQETYDKSAEYCMTKEDCRREMKKVDGHLREATIEVSNLESVLNEQAATLKRVLHVEGAYEEEKEYHPTSKKTMRETEKVMRGAEKLLNTAITKSGKLNLESVQALNNARAIYADYLARIYD